ncbi:EmrB/QacA subfamily drug resistance transporter [Nocardia transvalensis]|uniref:EmrB/QacA subfamily drug resistance transporter n=1 Tax=Nocardia transvalensis TaxID=37333 RepID=A0A7W9UGG9_9NOCA|nr:MFS transporter [Nocardia transvalensis]MBB5912137.1 EmrB/QacA subfamily drug resistance transporter [Nocardia transvalensis]
MSSPSQTPSFLATRRGKLTLVLLCTAAFLDFVDSSIVNLALPAIQREMRLPVSTLQWVTTGYLLTYGGLMLLGGRLADLLGRRRVLITGTAIIGLSSAAAGLAQNSELVIGARCTQGIGAALMLPAALSILTTSFREGSDRSTALGVWAGIAGLGAASGLLLGGLITQGPGWRWVFYVNVPVCVLILVVLPLLIPSDRRNDIRGGFDVFGTVLATGGLMLLVYALVEAPDRGWGSARTIVELAVAAALLAGFVINEHKFSNPLVPLSIFRIRGIAAADVTQGFVAAGMMSLFFFVTLYTQTVLGYGEIKAGCAYLPFSATIIVVSGVTSKIVPRTGTRPVIVIGALVTGIGILLLSRIPTDGAYLQDLLPGLMITAAGSAAVFVANTTAANAGVPADKAGLAAALLTTAQQLGVALGVAVLTAISISRTEGLLAAGQLPLDATTAGFRRALLVAGLIAAAGALTALRTVNTRGEEDAAVAAPSAETVTA